MVSSQTRKKPCLAITCLTNIDQAIILIVENIDTLLVSKVDRSKGQVIGVFTEKGAGHFWLAPEYSVGMLE